MYNSDLEEIYVYSNHRKSQNNCDAAHVVNKGPLSAELWKSD